MTLEEPMLIFIPRISSSKEPSPTRWLCLALIQLKGKLKRVESEVLLNVVCVERGVAPLFIHGSKVVLWLFLARSHGLHFLSMEPCCRLSKERLRHASREPVAP